MGGRGGPGAGPTAGDDDAPKELAGIIARKQHDPLWLAARRRPPPAPGPIECGRSGGTRAHVRPPDDTGGEHPNREQSEQGLHEAHVHSIVETREVVKHEESAHLPAGRVSRT